MSEINATRLVKFYFDRVVIRGPEGEYLDTRDNYELDAGKPAPPLPGNAIGRSYIPLGSGTDELHNLSDGTTDKPQVIPWPPGDQILADLQSLLDNQTARQASEPPDVESELNVLRLVAIDALMDESAAGANPPQAVLDYIIARDG